MNSDEHDGLLRQTTKRSAHMTRPSRGIGPALERLRESAATKPCARQAHALAGWTDHSRIRSSAQAREESGIMNFKEQLERLGACVDALEWVGDATFEQAWSTCERGDWMLWLAGRLRLDMKLLTLAKCDCARLSLQFVPADELRPLHAVETAERWARGEDSDEDLRAAGKAAYAAYAAYAAADARGATTYAVSAAYATAAYAAYAADAYAAYAAAAAYYAARVGDRWSTIKTCADLVRARIPAAAIAALLSEVT